MKLLPAIALVIVVLLIATDIESGVIIGGGLMALAGLLWLLDRAIGKK